MSSAGHHFRTALQQEKPLLIPGILNPFMALQAKEAGFHAAYVSGAGLSNFNYGVPDVGVIELDEVAHAVRAITRVCDMPLLVDIDTGWNNPELAVRTLIEAGAAAIHIEDQTEDKRCGHLDGKAVVSTEEMCARIRAAVKGKGANKDFMIMARTDAYALEGLDGAITRMQAYIEAGADAIFAEAMTDLAHYDLIRKAIGNVPLLANITEYGKTKLYTADELAAHSVDMMLMPVSVARAMHGMAMNWLREIHRDGTTKGMVERGELRPRSEYNAILNYNPETDNLTTIRSRLNKEKNHD